VYAGRHEHLLSGGVRQQVFMRIMPASAALNMNTCLILFIGVVRCESYETKVADEIIVTFISAK